MASNFLSPLPDGLLWEGQTWASGIGRLTFLGLSALQTEAELTFSVNSASKASTPLYHHHAGGAG